jgi:hypothetical protein
VTDPIYGDNPIDPTQLWNETFRPPLLGVMPFVAVRDVFGQMMSDLLESLWLTRWRRAVLTAEGYQLTERGEELAFLQPDGWTEDRYRDVLVALLPATFGRLTPQVVGNVATALLDVGQTFTMEEYAACSAEFVYYATSADDGQSYFSVLNGRARPKGCQYRLIAHDGVGAPFTVDTSTIDGPDTLAELFS